MAELKRRLPCNTEGEFFVDESCIDCSVCREIAPGIFGDGEETACVVKQPESEEELRDAFLALVSCPVSAIGTVSLKVPENVYNQLPIHIEDGVYLCGMASRKSYGALSYFIEHPEGNWLVDSPRYHPRLVDRIRSLGGVRFIFLTHEDDVADADRFAEEFSAKRIIHLEDSGVLPSAEIKITGYDPVPFGEDFLIIPTPGHTRGHMVLLYRNRYLFTGDHLAWSRRRNGIVAFRDYCWHSWEELKRSMVRLLDYEFEWIMPGHGYRAKISKKEFERFVRDLLKE